MTRQDGETKYKNIKELSDDIGGLIDDNKKQNNQVSNKKKEKADKYGLN
jgi:hypothetical protein